MDKRTDFFSRNKLIINMVIGELSKLSMLSSSEMHLDTVHDSKICANNGSYNELARGEGRKAGN